MSQFKNVIGEKWSRFTIVEHLESKMSGGQKVKRVRAVCECGNFRDVEYKDLKRGKRKSCGCLYETHKIQVNEGDAYGNFTIIKEVEKYRSPQGATLRRFLCSCRCGKEIEHNLNTLTAQRVISCGCILPKQRIKRTEPLPIKPLDIERTNSRLENSWVVLKEISNKRDSRELIKRKVLAQCKCGHKQEINLDTVFKGAGMCYSCYIKHCKEDRETEEYLIKNEIRIKYSSIKSRCYNPNSKDYPRYGGRGITMCEEWINDFEIFYKWCLDNGYDKSLQIDRKNNDGNYEPNNCRYVTQAENNRNTSRIVMNWDIVDKIRDGEYKNLPPSEVARLTGISAGTISTVKNNKTWKYDS